MSEGGGTLEVLFRCQHSIFKLPLIFHYAIHIYLIPTYLHDAHYLWILTSHQWNIVFNHHYYVYFV